MATTSHPLYVSGDFGHGDRIPSFLCFRWFRSWQLRLILCMFQVISIIATASCPFYVSSDFSHCDHVPYILGDFGHCDLVPFFVCFRWFRSWRPRPLFFMFQVISIIATASHMIQVFSVIAIASHSFLWFSDSDHYDHVPFLSLDLGDTSLCTPRPHNFIFHPTFV